MARWTILAGGVLLAVTPVLGACSATYEEKSGTMFIDKDLLAAQVQSQLTKQLGKQAPAIECPDNLPAEVGATTTCVMTAPKDTYNVTVTVTKLDPGDAGNYPMGNAIFDAKLAEEPNR